MVAMATVPTEIRSADTGLGRVVQPFNDRTTWGGALHLLLGLPLGVAYFAFYVAGLATSAALSLLIVGLPLLLAMLATIRPLVLFEARMARALAGVDVAEPAPAARRLGALLRDDATWRRLAYLLSRFPIGIVSFALAAVIIVLPLGLLASPILYSTAGPGTTPSPKRSRASARSRTPPDPRERSRPDPASHCAARCRSPLPRRRRKRLRGNAHTRRQTS